ncbi:MAG TPA: XrtA system polysaccharide deacetylase [Stellaceae bacterium]|nr:XrtA system polysaccharide deacetylase [Stellaceae bacterium]
MDGLAVFGRDTPVLRRASRVVNALTVDVEDYFQVEALAHAVPRSAWDLMPSRVEANVDRLLALFDDNGVKATFFTLGWIAERHKAMVRRIVALGHELASHGVNHIRADRQSRDAFAADIRRSKALLEDVGQAPVKGYRAATFSIGTANLWALDELAAAGFAYSSSIYPIAHDLYGMPMAPRRPFRANPCAVLEVPLSTVRVGGRNLPASGGGYFRLLPYALSRAAFRRVNQVEDRPAIFYMHPWEIDAAQPRVAGLSAKSRFRHYLNLRRMYGRLERLLGDFAWDRMDTVFLGPGQ